MENFCYQQRVSESFQVLSAGLSEGIEGSAVMKALIIASIGVACGVIANLLLGNPKYRELSKWLALGAFVLGLSSVILVGLEG